VLSTRERESWSCVARPNPTPRARALGTCNYGHPTPPRGRPQGSHPRSTPLPPLQRLRDTDELQRVFVGAGVGLMRGWDPCGRPRGGVRWPSPCVSGRTRSPWGGVAITQPVGEDTVALGWGGGLLAYRGGHGRTRAGVEASLPGSRSVLALCMREREHWVRAARPNPSPGRESWAPATTATQPHPRATARVPTPLYTAPALTKIRGVGSIAVSKIDVLL